jgi:hypothetical protein
MPRRLCTLAAFVALLGAGCGSLEAKPPAPFQVRIRVTGDAGRALAGVTVLRDTKELGATQADGTILVALNGTEGETVDLTIRCPQNYDSPKRPVSVTLVRFVDIQKVPEYGAACAALERRVVVAVRAVNGANLPVRYLGNTVARTDVAGAAHFELAVRPNEPFAVTIDTSEKGSDRLKPQNPSREFNVGAYEGIILFNQVFVQEKKPVVYVARPTGPVKINQ